MNIKFHNIPTRFLWASLVSVLVLTAGCEKDDTDGPKPPAASGKVAFLNAAFGSDSVNLFVDTKKANSKLLGYGDSLTYVDVAAGDRAFELKEKDGESVVKKTFDIEKDKAYSILATNSEDGETFELIRVSDDLTAPKTDKAKIRLIHLSPDAGKLDLVSGEATLASDVAYKSASAYKEVDAEETSFDIVDAETAETLLTVDELELGEGKIYTIWVSGLEETADVEKKMQAHVFFNK